MKRFNTLKEVLNHIDKKGLNLGLDVGYTFNHKINKYEVL